MKNQSVIDTIIIGQGLAGSLLAWHLLQSGQKIRIIDDDHRTSSSRIAAGIINPITGKRLVKTDNVETFLPEALSLYKGLSEKFNKPFYQPRQIRRLFQSQQELSLWRKRNTDTGYKPYLGKLYAPNDLDLYADPLGSFSQKQTGFLDMATLLTELAKYFEQKRSYLQENIGYQEIKVIDNVVHLKGLRARRLIFCEGYQAINNPWFSTLPFKPAKGDILTLKTDSNLPADIINRGKWLLPLTEDVIKFGATFQWDDLTTKPSGTAKKELIAACRMLFHPSVSFKVINHEAGVRPSSKDRTPFLGMHKQDRQLGIFNGFGAKGSLIIPHYAKLFSDYLLGRGFIPPYADVNRY